MDLLCFNLVSVVRVLPIRDAPILSLDSSVCLEIPLSEPPPPLFLLVKLNPQLLNNSIYQDSQNLQESKETTSSCSIKISFPNFLLWWDNLDLRGKEVSPI